MKLRFHCDICDTPYESADACGKCERSHDVAAFKIVASYTGSNTRPKNATFVHLMPRGGNVTICGMLKTTDVREPAQDEKWQLCEACNNCRFALQLK